MQCERLIKLAKTWYLHVRDETMAPARMVSFIKQHVAECEECLADPDIQAEIEKITEIILPESKIPKAVRLAQEKENNKQNNGDADDPEDMDDDSVDTGDDPEDTDDDSVDTGDDPEDMDDDSVDTGDDLVDTDNDLVDEI